MHPPKALFFLLTLVLSSFLLSGGTADDAEPDTDPCGPENLTTAPGDITDVGLICVCAKNQKTCMSTAASLSPGINQTDAVAVVNLHMEAARRNVAAAKGAAVGLANDPNANPATKPVLNKCIANYDAAARSIEKAAKAFKKYQEYFVVKNMSSVSKQFRKCEKAFKKANLPSPLTKYADTNRPIIGDYLSIYTKFWQYDPKQQPPPVRPAPPRPPTAPLGDMGIRDMCGKTRYPDVCVSTILQPAAATADIVTALKLSIDASLRISRPLLERVKVMADDAKLGEVAKYGNYMCLKKLDGVVFLYDEAKSDIDKNDIWQAKNEITWNANSLSGYICDYVSIDGKRVEWIPANDRDMLEKLGQVNSDISNIIWPEKPTLP